MSENLVGFHYGAFADALEKQANEQGYTLGEKAEYLERCKKAIMTLMFADILPDSQVNKAYQKLNKQVSKALKPLKQGGKQ